MLPFSHSSGWIRKQTKVRDILTTIKRKRWTCAGHVMRRTDKKCTVRVTEWQPKDDKNGKADRELDGKIR